MKANKRRFVIISVALIAILLMALTAAAVYAIVADGDPLEALLRRQSTADSRLALVQDPDNNEPATLFDQGVLVRAVDPDSPAAAAGIRRGSIILSVDGRETNTTKALTEALAEKGAGAVVTLRVLNSAEPEDVSVTLAEAAPFLGVRLVPDVGPGQFRIEEDENCVCGFDFQMPEDMEEFHGLPETFHFEGMEGLSGVFIREAVEDSAAAAAGLQAGDQIETLDGQAVDSVEQLVELIGSKAPGDMVTLTVLRDDETQEFTATLGADPDDESKAFLGVLLSSRMGMMRGRIPETLPFGPEFGPEGKMMHGVVVVEVVDASAAAAAGIQQGDLIEAVDGEALHSVDELVDLVAAGSPGDEMILTINREGESLDVPVTLGAHPDKADQAYLGVQLVAFFNLHMERPEEGNGATPGEFFFHMQPGEDLQEFFDNHFRRQLQQQENEFDA